MTPAPNRTAYAAWLVVCVLWGTTYLAIAIALETLPPLFMAGFRYIVAGALLDPPPQAFMFVHRRWILIIAAGMAFVIAASPAALICGEPRAVRADGDESPSHALSGHARDRNLQ